MRRIVVACVATALAGAASVESSAAGDELAPGECLLRVNGPDYVRALACVAPTLTGEAAAFVARIPPGHQLTTGECLLRVRGRDYIRGRCEIHLYGKLERDGFAIATLGTRRWRAGIGIGDEDSKDRSSAWGSWNHPVVAKPGKFVIGLNGKPTDWVAEEGFGRLKRAGRWCWANRMARICAKPD
jgi:hypothetical protein